MHSTPTKPSPLWAACALPGDGPEYRSTATPSRNPLRVLRTHLWARRVRKEAC